MTRNNADASAVLIAGPTASGKSALALDYARRLGGTVVNADSMQVYRGIPILTAQPSEADVTAVPHRLYGHVEPSADYSVGKWSRDVAAVLADLQNDGRVPVIVGGTGLYFRALLGGLDDMPPVPEAVRASLREWMARDGPLVLHAELTRRDPGAASRIRPSDPQRILRALELVETTGRPLGDVQRGGSVPLVDAASAIKLVLRPDRERLRERIARRFDAMLAAGAMDEAARFRARFGPGFTGTAAKAIGLRELIDHLEGEQSLAAAAAKAVTRSRQYAKRQDTWFRHQLDASWLPIPC